MIPVPRGESMSESKAQRKARHAAILEQLNAPGGKARSDADIAASIGCSAKSVRYVRRANPTPEEQAQREQETLAHIKALDECGLFPGMYQWYLDRQAKKNAPQPAPDGLGMELIIGRIWFQGMC